jgi:dsDNA-specific endonuclease/ATPase MutS2
VEENTNMNAEYERCSTTGSKNDEKSKNETHGIEAGGFLETFKDLGGKTVQATQVSLVRLMFYSGP